MSYELFDKETPEVSEIIQKIPETIKRNTKTEAEKLAEAIIKRLEWQSERMAFREQQHLECIKHRRRK